MKTLFRCFVVHALVVASLVLAACRKDNREVIPGLTEGSADTLAATLTLPQRLDIYPVVTNNGNGVGRVFIKALQVGNLPVNFNMLFDTGSAGVTINALDIFPASIVNENGFKFRNGQDTLQYQGITITKINVQKVYGSNGAIETRQTGNIGYARLTVGSTAANVKMLKMPILFYYKATANGTPVTNGLNSVFGVNTSFNGAQSTADSTVVFRLVSPFKYLVYQNNLVAGFKLDAVALNGCAINTAGSCPPQPVLTVGLTTTDQNNYRLNQLALIGTMPATALPMGYPAYPRLPLYSPGIAEATVGTAYRTRTVSVLLDTGNPGMILNVAKDSVRAGNFPVIRLALPSGNTYSYNLNTANFTTTFNTASSRSVFGVYFFTQFDFMEDYQNGLIGLRVKQQ